MIAGRLLGCLQVERWGDMFSNRLCMRLATFRLFL